MENETTIKEKNNLVFLPPHNKKAESQPTFGTLPFARHASQCFAKVKEPNHAFTQYCITLK